jgi:hypothetical protein
VVEEEEVVGLCATGAIGWDILPGSALKERGMREERGEAVEEGGAVIMEVVEDPSVTSAIGRVKAIVNYSVIIFLNFQVWTFRPRVSRGGGSLLQVPW